MKVWLVIETDGYEFSDVKVFSVKENAEKYVKYLMNENPAKIVTHGVQLHEEQVL